MVIGAAGYSHGGGSRLHLFQCNSATLPDNLALSVRIQGGLPTASGTKLLPRECDTHRQSHGNGERNDYPRGTVRHDPSQLADGCRNSQGMTPETNSVIQASIVRFLHFHRRRPQPLTCEHAKGFKRIRTAQWRPATPAGCHSRSPVRYSPGPAENCRGGSSDRRFRIFWRAFLTRAQSRLEKLGPVLRGERFGFCSAPLFFGLTKLGRWTVRVCCGCRRVPVRFRGGRCVCTMSLEEDRGCA